MGIALVSLDSMMRNIAKALSILPNFTPYITLMTSLQALDPTFSPQLDSAIQCTTGSPIPYATCWDSSLQTPTGNRTYFTFIP
jgi:hypothetical protein